LKKAFLACVALVASVAPVFAQGTAVYDSIPSPLPPNVVSEGFQCCQNFEFGDEIKLEPSTPRRVGYVTLVMSDWAKHSDYPSMPAAGYTHPITLSVYDNAVNAAAHTPMKTVTTTFTIPWRPENDPSCPDGMAWKASDGNCYHGLAFKITFDVRSWNLDLPEQFIYGVAYNTNTWGYSPLGVSGPYESLNVGLNGAPPVAVGTDVNPDSIYRNYLGNGFTEESGWTPYTPAIQFRTFALPTVASDCKNGAWQNLVRANFTPFKNQGDCVSYVNTGK